MKTFRKATPPWTLLTSVVLLLGALPASGQGLPEGDTLSLAEAVSLAVANHPSVARARARSAGQASALDEVESELLPSLGLSFTPTRHEEPMIVAPLHSFDLGTRPEFDRSHLPARLGAEYLLFDWGGRSARIEGSRAEAAAAEAGTSQALMQVIRMVAETYLRGAAEREVVAAHRNRVDALEAELLRVQLLEREGRVPAVDRMRAEAAITRARADLGSSERSYALLRRELERLTGAVSGSLAVRPLTPDPLDLGTVNAELDALRAPDPARHPALLQATHERAAAEAAREAAESARFPRLDATGAVQQYASWGGTYTNEWQAGVRISYPLFTGGAREARIERAGAATRAASETLRLHTLEITSAADRARTAADDADARVVALEAALVQLGEVARIEALAVSEGVGVEQDYLDAEADLLEARAALAGARAEAAAARIRLAEALGVLSEEWIRRMATGPAREEASR